MTQATTEKTASKKATTQRRRPRAQAGATSVGTTKTPSVQSTASSRSTTAGPSVPVIVPEVHIRHLRLPQVDLRRMPVPGVHLPEVNVPEGVRRLVPDAANNRLLWYGGLAGLAAVGVIGWPVAGVVAAGTYVAELRAKSAMHQSGADPRRARAKASSSSETS